MCQCLQILREIVDMKRIYDRTNRWCASVSNLVEIVGWVEWTRATTGRRETVVELIPQIMEENVEEMKMSSRSGFLRGFAIDRGVLVLQIMEWFRRRTAEQIVDVLRGHPVFTRPPPSLIGTFMCSPRLLPNFIRCSACMCANAETCNVIFGHLQRAPHHRVPDVAHRNVPRLPLDVHAAKPDGELAAARSGMAPALQTFSGDRVRSLHCTDRELRGGALRRQQGQPKAKRAECFVEKRTGMNFRRKVHQCRCPDLWIWWWQNQDLFFWCRAICRVISPRETWVIPKAWRMWRLNQVSVRTSIWRQIADTSPFPAKHFQEVNPEPTQEESSWKQERRSNFEIKVKEREFALDILLETEAECRPRQIRRRIWYRAEPDTSLWWDEHIDMGIIHRTFNASSHPSWTKLQWVSGSLQELVRGRDLEFT